MRAPDEPRRCQYIRTDGRRCNAPLSGRGRFKWCPEHEVLVRKQQRDANNAQWQKAWRIRHEYLDWMREWIYQVVKKAEKELLAYYPQANARLIHKALLRSFRELIDPTLACQPTQVAFAQVRDYTEFLFAVEIGGDPDLYRPWTAILWNKRIVKDDLGENVMVVCPKDADDIAYNRFFVGLLRAVLKMGWTGERPALVFGMPNFLPLTGQVCLWAVLSGASTQSWRKLPTHLRKVILPALRKLPVTSNVVAGQPGSIVLDGIPGRIVPPSALKITS